METITLKDLLQATGGRLLPGGLQDPAKTISGVKSDNRLCSQGDVFFAFCGERTDGHRFVDSALANGAAGAVVSHDSVDAEGKSLYHIAPDKFYARVDDTILAAGDLARYYRTQFSIPVVGVTGSVGKTTMKDMIASVLSQRFRTVKTEANYNNNIGLPRTILRLDKSTQMAVFEMGMNHQGEIRYLVHIAQPTVAVITNIGEAHIGNLGSRENIFKAKCEIFEGLSRGGLAVMNADDEYLPRLRQDADKQNQFHFLWVGESDSADFRAVNIDDTLQECVKFHALTPAGEFDVTVPALGRHMIYPALVSIAIGQHYGMSTGEILQGIRAYVPTAMRMETYHCPDNITIYNDTYNANPQSMKAGLTTLAHTKTKGARVAVLGDMLELGEMEERLHREIGAAVAALPVNTLITVGRRARWIADEARHKGMADVQSFDTAQQAQTALKPLLLPDTAIYFKASHLMALDQLATWCHAECDKR